MPGVSTKMIWGVGPGQDAPQAVAGGLRFGGDDGDLFPQPGVDECGFTHVRLADDGHESRAVVGGQLVV